ISRNVGRGDRGLITAPMAGKKIARIVALLMRLREAHPSDRPNGAFGTTRPLQLREIASAEAVQPASHHIRQVDEAEVGRLHQYSVAAGPSPPGCGSRSATATPGRSAPVPTGRDAPRQRGSAAAGGPPPGATQGTPAAEWSTPPSRGRGAPGPHSAR